MPRNYRYYRLDRTGQLHNCVSFQAEGDDDAITQIEAKHPNDKCEIWESKRLVATLSAGRASSSMKTSRKAPSEPQRVPKGTAALVAWKSRLGSGGDAR